MKKTSRVKPYSLIFLTVAGFVTMFFLGFVIISFTIGRNVRALCREAVTRYGGDCVSALSRTVEDEGNTYRTRNDAVWALGQLGDRRALPTIGKYFTGAIPPQEAYDGTLSQYELFKAANLIQSGFNITAFLWR